MCAELAFGLSAQLIIVLIQNALRVVARIALRNYYFEIHFLKFPKSQAADLKSIVGEIGRNKYSGAEKRKVIFLFLRASPN